MASKRFPGKALALIHGREMIRHVYANTKAYKRFDRIVVATDEPRIKSLIEADGGEVWYSQVPFRNGTERCAAAAGELSCDIVVNVQGDEVSLAPEQIDATVRMIELDIALHMSTLAFPISDDDLDDPNLVKVAVSEHGRAIDFSRQPIMRAERKIVNYGHAGVYVFRKDFLMTYARLEPTPRELSESLEQLRVLESGFAIGVAILDQPMLSVNTPEDLKIANQRLTDEGGATR